MRLHGRFQPIRSGDGRLDAELAQWRYLLELVAGSTWDGVAGLALTAGAGLVATALESGTQVDVGAGNGIQVTADAVAVRLDGATLSVSVSGLKISAGGVGPTELAASVAGAGLTGGAGSALAVNPDGVTLEVTADQVKLRSAGVTETHLAASVAGAGLTGGAGAALAVNTDGVTLEVSGDQVQVRDAGIGATQLAAAVAGAGLAGGAGSALSLDVRRETPAGAVDGANTAFTLATAPMASGEFVFKNGVLQHPAGVDYTLSGTTVTFTVAPAGGSILWAVYFAA
jgi:hypothetical protein